MRSPAPGRRCALLDVALQVALAVGVGLGACWLLLLGVLAVARPRGGLLTEAVRLLPDLVRLSTRLARDPTLARGVRWRLAALAAYLAFPIDLVPDVIPVLGYADDAILVAWTLRSVIRHAGIDVVRRHWPGTDDGLRVVLLLCGVGMSGKGRTAGTESA